MKPLDFQPSIGKDNKNNPQGQKHLFAENGQLYSGEFRSKKTRKQTGIPATNDDFRQYAQGYLDSRMKSIGLDAPPQIDGVDTFACLPEFPKGFDIIYFNLDGSLATWKDANGKEKAYSRARFCPGLEEKNTDGKPYKYKTPAGAPILPYLNGLYLHFRDRLQDIETLFFTEGELKALAGCMAGLPTVGISGIHNFGKVEKDDRGKTIGCHFIDGITDLFRQLPGLKNIAFMHDGDCRQPGGTPGKREWSFYTSVANFKRAAGHYSYKYHYCHIKEGLPKGLDDLLEERRDDAAAIVQNALALKPHDWFEFIDLKKTSDKKLREYFRATKDFNLEYQERKLAEKNAEKSLEGAKKVEDSEYEFDRFEHEFWAYTDKKVVFQYVESVAFLQANGFYRAGVTGKEVFWIRLQNNIVRELESHRPVRDFANKFVKLRQEKPILEMIYSGGSRYFGPEALSNLEMIEIREHESSSNVQYMYFMNGAWKITRDNIEVVPYEELDGSVWDKSIIDIAPQLDARPLPTLERKEDGSFFLDIPEAGQIDFLDYLWNTSRLYWREEEAATITPAQSQEQVRAFVNKVCAAGYMLHRHFNPSKSYAVLCLDYMITDVGQSDGGTGKSLFGKALKRITNTFTVNGKKNKLFEYDFLYHGVDERTHIVFFDDVRINFDFQNLYNPLTGMFSVNPKNGQPYVIPEEKTPKIIVATNHQVHDNGASDLRRKWSVPFGDYYHTGRKPDMEMGHNMLGDDWPLDQMNHFVNIMAWCVQVYFKFGKIEAGTANLRKRQLKQDMGETFLEWADTYFRDSDHLHPCSPNINGMPRKDMYSDFLSEGVTSKEREFYKQTRFKKCLKMYCEYQGYIFNYSSVNDKGEPHGGDIKIRGKEFIRIAIAPENPNNEETGQQGEEMPF